jgi:hypothetical protein
LSIHLISSTLLLSGLGAAELHSQNKKGSFKPQTGDSRSLAVAQPAVNSAIKITFGVNFLPKLMFKAAAPKIVSKKN